MNNLELKIFRVMMGFILLLSLIQIAFLLVFKGVSGGIFIYPAFLFGIFPALTIGTILGDIMLAIGIKRIIKGKGPRNDIDPAFAIIVILLGVIVTPYIFYSELINK